MINIIGGAGFVGTRLADVLTKQATPFRTFDKTLDGNQYIDVAEPSTFNHLPGADCAINLAAEHRDDVTPKSLYDLVNVEGAKNVCDYCRQKDVSSIIFTSSVAVYGFAPEGTDESGRLDPFNDYGRTKMEAEEVYRDWLAEAPDSRSLVIVRPTVIFGEQNRGNVYNLLNQIAKKRFVMFGTGKNKKSMAYVQNVAEFLAFSITLGPGLHIYNYVDKPDLDMNTLVRETRAILFNTNSVGVKLPRILGYLIGYACDLVATSTGLKLPVSSIRVKKFLQTTSFKTSVSSSGFMPTYTLKEGLKRTLLHEFRENHTGKKLYYSE